MNVGNKGHVRHSLANLFEGHRSVVIRDLDAHYLTAGAHHFLDLLYGSVHIGSVRLSHRLNDARSATTDLQVLDLNWFRLSHDRFAKSPINSRKLGAHGGTPYKLGPISREQWRQVSPARSP